MQLVSLVEALSGRTAGPLLASIREFPEFKRITDRAAERVAPFVGINGAVATRI